MIVLSASIHFIVAGLMQAVANLVGLIAWRNGPASDWMERARLLFPARVTASLNVVLVPFILSFAHYVLFPSLPRWWLSDAAASFVGVVLAGYFFDRECFPPLIFREWLRPLAIVWGLRFGVWMPFVAACFLMPKTFDMRVPLVAGGYLALHFAIRWGMLLRYLRWVNFIKPAQSRLQRIMDEMAAQQNISVRAVWQMEGWLANAFAFTATREIVVTNRLLDICNDKEVRAICAHELAHLGESKTVLVGHLLSSLGFFPLIFTIPAISQFKTSGFASLFLITLAIQVFTIKLTRRMEHRADARASSQQVDEGVYAAALEKLYRENKMPAVNATDNQTHPHLYDRMLAAGITPKLSRPAKPARLTRVGWVYVGILAVLMLLSVAQS